MRKRPPSRFNSRHTGWPRDDDYYARRAREWGPARPHYETRESSRAFSGLAGTLASFALAVIVLLITRTAECAQTRAVDVLCAPSGLLRDRVVIALLVSFSGCVTASFLFATIAAEDVVSPR